MSEPSTLRQQLEADLKTAMKSGDTTSRDAIRFLMAALKNAEIDHHGPLPVAEASALLQQQAKRMRDAIEQFEAGHRQDLADRERSQLAVLERYLPKAMTDDEIAVLVATAIGDAGALGPKDMGKVMPLVIGRAAGRADGRRLSAAVKAALANG
jgi:hypothetical protein